MSSFPALRTWPAPVPVALTALGVALVAAFLLAPAALLRGAFGAYADPVALERAVGQALTTYVQSGQDDYPATLAHLQDYWFFWHLIKMVICVLLVSTLVALSAVLWSRSVSAGRGGAVIAAIGAVTASSFAFGATVVLLANTQSTAAPMIALLQVLPGSSTEAE
ncbi:MAG: hypothetical protein Q7T71_03010, partial [Herbiconiux sp.]|nr:hypothetical protein [Herbiconiux sp.]